MPITMDHMLKFTNLDTNLKNGFPSFPLYSFAWRFTDNNEEYWTAQLNSFKSNNHIAVKRVCSFIPGLLERNIMQLTEQPFVLLSAIPSNFEILPSGSNMSLLCQAIKGRFKCYWDHTILAKELHKSLHKIRSGAEERDREIHNKYNCRKFPVDYKAIMVVDDFVTRGSTFYEIIRSVYDTNNQIEDVYLFSVGKTENISYNHFANNDHLSGDFRKNWESVS